MGVALTLLISLLLLGPSGEPRVEWVGADSCPGAEHELELALDDYVGEAVLDTSVAARVMLIDVGGTGMQLTLTLESAAGTEQHELRGLGCEQLVDQAALLLAGAIDPFVYWRGDHRMQHEVVPIQRPLVVEHEPEPEPLLEPESEHSPEPELSLEPRASFQPLVQPLVQPRVQPLATSDRAPRDQSRRAANQGSLGVAATSFVGLFPQIGGGAQIEGGLDRGAFRWQSSLTGYFGGRFRASDADVGANLGALAGSTGLCGVLQAKRIRVPLCGVVGVGAISARAVGTIEPRSSVRPWVHVGGEAGVSLLARPNLAVGLGLGVHVAIVRPSWEVRSPDVHYTIPPVMGLVRLSVEIRGLGDQNARP
jgi:hypothetical protein